jgi:hypothetical protein
MKKMVDKLSTNKKDHLKESNQNINNRKLKTKELMYFKEFDAL